jgi:hypothetical protein
MGRPIELRMWASGSPEGPGSLATTPATCSLSLSGKRVSNALCVFVSIPLEHAAANVAHSSQIDDHLDLM